MCNVVWFQLLTKCRNDWSFLAYVLRYSSGCDVVILNVLFLIVSWYNLENVPKVRND